MKLSLAFCSVLCSVIVPASAAVFSHYSFDSNFDDNSGNGRNGSLVNAGSLPSGITNTAGDFVFGGGAMDFSADRDYLAIPSKTFGTGSAYTIAFWAKKAPGDTGDPAKWDMVIGQRVDTKFFIGLNDGAGITWRSNNQASGTRQASFTAPDDTNWHHYAITADSGKNMTFYLDGVGQPTLSNVETGFIIDTIGEAYPSSRDFDMHGQIDEVWIFDEALDATAVSNLEAFNTIVPEPGTTALATIAALGLLRRRR